MRVDLDGVEGKVFDLGHIEHSYTLRHKHLGKHEGKEELVAESRCPRR